MKRLLGLLIMITLICGCAPKLRFEADWESYETVSKDHGLMILPADFETSWSAVRQVVNEMGFKEVIADSDSGSLMCSMPQKPWDNTTLEMNILLHEKDVMLTDVYVNSVVLAVPTGMGMELQVYPSDNNAKIKLFEQLAGKLGVSGQDMARNATPPGSRLSTTVTAIESDPSDYLDTQEIRGLFNNRTVYGYHNKRAYSFVRSYFDDGRLTGSSDMKGDRSGVWEVNVSGLCEQWAGKQMKCRRLKKENDYISKYNDKGVLLVTYKEFKQNLAP